MTTNVPRRRGAALLLAAVCALPWAAPARATAAAIVVHPGAMATWAIVNVDPSAGTETSAPTSRGTTTKAVDGPAGTPKGLGSFRQLIGNPDDVARLDSSEIDGARLSDVGGLAYSTYVAAGGSGVATQIELLVDLNADGRYRLVDDDVLTFDPLYQTGGAYGDIVPNQCAGVAGCIGKDRWQRWNGMTGGWVSYKDAHGGAPVVTLSHYQTLHPSARLASDVDALRLVAGGGGNGSGWQGFDGSVDDVVVGSNEYDFESMFLLADCGASNDDITLVQSKVDAAPPGYGVHLRGSCDFAQALPHGGTTTSIDAAAVVLRSSGPASDLVIEAEGAPRSAAVTGSGTQAAFFVPPGSSNVTIRGLTFSNFGRAIVVVDASGVTIGAPGTLSPNPEANSISGGPGMSSAILAVADPGGASHTISVRYGSAGASVATYPASASPVLAGLSIEGNRIAFDSPGVPDGTRHLVAVDVRQTMGASGSGIDIGHNAAWFGTGEIRSFDMNGIRIEGGASSSGSLSGVLVHDNSIGRPEEAGESAPPPAAAGGRIGIFMHRTSGASVRGNRVRAKLSTTPGPVPGGGIVASDTTGSVIEANVVDVLGDATAAASDLGGIGIVDDVDVLVGGAADSQPSTNATVSNNVIGGAAMGAGRGILVDGSSWVDASGNSVPGSSGPALAVAAAVKGPSSSATFPLSVSTSVLCNNDLHGITDDANQVSIGLSAVVSASNVPGGGAIAGNGECADPAIGLGETDGSTRISEGGTGDAIGVALNQRPRADVSVAIAAGTQATVFPATLIFTPQDWAMSQSVDIDAVDDSVSEGTHLQALTFSATSGDAAYAGKATSMLVTILDNDPGSIMVAETGGSTDVAEGGAVDSYSIVLGSRPGADVSISMAPDSQLVTNPLSVTFTQANWSIPRQVTVSAADDTLREGPHTGHISHRVTSTDVNFNSVSVAGILAQIADNDRPPPPVITAPAEGARARATSVVVAGTGEPLGTVEVKEANVVLGTAVVSNQGRWNTSAIGFTEGFHSITASLVDRNGFRSVASARSFRVDLTPPPKPVITYPDEGVTYHLATLAVKGTSDAGDTISVSEGSVMHTTVADSQGNWTVSITFTAAGHTIVAVAPDGAGNPGPASDPRSFIVDADGIAPDPPTVLSPVNGSIVPLTRKIDGSTYSGLEITGFAEPMAEIDTYDGGTLLYIDFAGPDGFFDSLLNTVNVPDARPYHLRIRAADASGNYGLFAPTITVTVDGSPPIVAVRRDANQPVIAIVMPGATVMSFGIAGDDYGVARVAVTYTDQLGTAIHHDAALTCQTVTSCKWEDGEPVPPGEYRVNAQATDVAGNVSKISSTPSIIL